MTSVANADFAGEFDVYVAATVVVDGNNNNTDWYIAKFSTRYNFTEWYR